MTMGTNRKGARARVIARRHTIMWVLAAGFVATLMGPAGAGAAELPENDPFYQPPVAGEPHEHWQEEAPGTVLKKRAISIYGYSAYQLLFRSNNGQGEPIVAVTTVGIPRNPYTGVGERPFVSYQLAIDSLGSQCNPSYELQQGSEDEEGEAAALLEKGWYVNIPDHEGEDMEFAAGPNGAHITLDSIRAAYNAGIGISTKNPLGLIGYSGGGQATDFAMLEQPTYAPELHILAAAPGGIPVDIQETVEHNNGGAAFGLVIGGTIGVNRGFPELELYSLLNAEGLSTFKTVEKQCLTEYVSNPSYAFKKLGEYTKPEYAEPLTLPKVEHVTGLDSIGTAPGMLNDGLPSYPVLLWQSKADEIVPPAGVERLANYYCSEGVDVTFDLGASGEHVTYQIDNFPAAAAYLEAVFAGTPEASTCGVNASENTKIDSGPSGKTNEDSATFTYAAEPDVAGTSFECKLDGAEFASCPESGVTDSELAAGPHTFAVRSVTATGDKDVSPATQSFTVSGADVGVSISAAPNPAKVKKALTYTITVANAGPEAASGVVLTNALAGSLKVRSAAASHGTCTRPKGKSFSRSITCSLGALEAGAKDTVTIVVKPKEAGTVSDTSSVTDSGPPDRTPADQTATQKVTVESKS